MSEERFREIENRLSKVENQTNDIEGRVNNLEINEREILFKIESLFGLSKYFTETARDIKKDQRAIKASVDYIAQFIMRTQGAES